MDFTPFIEHLEYLGYTTRVVPGETLDIMFAEAPGKPDFNLSKIKGLTFLLARSNWNILSLPQNIDSIINDLNAKSVNVSSVWRYAVPENKEALGISSAYFGDYDKKNFGFFLDAYLADINRVIASEEGQKILKAPADA